MNSTSRVARLGLDAHPDFGELARAAGLLFVAVLGFGFGFDCFTERNARLDEFKVESDSGV